MSIMWKLLQFSMTEGTYLCTGLYVLDTVRTFYEPRFFSTLAQYLDIWQRHKRMNEREWPYQQTIKEKANS